MGETKQGNVMSEFESRLSAFAESGDMKTRIEEFIADAKKLKQPHAVALPLLKLLNTLLVVLAVMPKKDGRLLVQFFYEDAQNPDKNDSFHADVCHPDELSVQRIAKLIEKGRSALLAEYPQDTDAPLEIVILRLSLTLILNQLEG